MPATFPRFVPLDSAHRDQIETITKQFPPYSDFNFTSLYSWNTAEAAAFSTLQGNLIIRFNDYLTGEPFYSFLGQTDVNKTAEALLSLTEAEGRPIEIKLIPESTAKNVDTTQFLVTEDTDNFDYILSVDQLKALAGSQFVKHRNKVSKFTRTYQTDTRLLDLSDPAVQNNLEHLFIKWEEWKQLPPAETKNEFMAVSRLFDLKSKDNLITIGVFFQNELLGFAISELLPDGYGMLHFEKATPSGFTGVYQYLKQETARVLSDRDCQLLNCQQDLGLPGLRTHKMGLCPVAFLRKYRVTWRE